MHEYADTLPSHDETLRSYCDSGAPAR
jgi:hypothetical protein